MRTLLSAVTLLAAAGCERPFVETTTPDITVVSPDMSTAFLSDNTQLVLAASSFRDVIMVSVNGVPMTRDSSTGHWFQNLNLSNGLNAFVVEASDLDNVTTTDTLYALRIGIGRASLSPDMPSGRGGHTATRLNDGRLVVMGGAFTADGNAVDEVLEVNNITSSFRIGSTRLITPRVGHTASPLPDGRILIVGGADNASVPSVASLVESVEVYNPNTNQTTPVPFRGGPIRRAYHTANVRFFDGVTVIDLYGGRGDVAYTPQPRLGIRSDIRTFQFRNDSLIALSPSVGGFLIGPSWGHTQTSLFGSDPAPTEYLISGGLFDTSVREETAAIVDFADPRGLVPEYVALPAIPRTQHADVRLQGGFVAFFGGRTDAGSSVTQNVEIFSRQARRFFSVPVANFQSVARYAHRSTLYTADRIVITGGFDALGNGVAASEVLAIEL